MEEDLTNYVSKLGKRLIKKTESKGKKSIYRIDFFFYYVENNKNKIIRFKIFLNKYGLFYKIGLK